VAICYLILSLAIVTRDSPILQSLIGVRRNIVFNRVEINSAASQAEIALKGMEVPDAIQKDLPPILALVERLNEDTSRLEFQVDTMQAHLPRSGDSEDTVSAKIGILTAHRNNAEALLKDRESTLQELNSNFQQLMKRRQRIQGVMPETADFFEQLDTGMKTILEESDSRFNQYVEKANKYDEQLAKGISAIKEA
jgi:chromosome segregation ATPase